MTKNIKKIIVLAMVLIANYTISQTLEGKLQKITTKIANDLKNKPHFNVAVYPFTSLKKSENNLTMHIFGEFHEALSGKVKTMNRETLDSYMAEHKLKSDALINPKTAKEFGMLIMADGYITGKIYKFGSVLNFQVKITDTETGEILSYTSEKIPIDYDMAEFLELKNWKKEQIKASENKSDNPNCEELNVGDYCFENNTGIETEVVIFKNGFQTKKLVLFSKSKGCFKDLNVGSYSYRVIRKDRLNIAGRSNIINQGYFTIKKCGSHLQKILP